MLSFFSLLGIKNINKRIHLARKYLGKGLMRVRLLEVFASICSRILYRGRKKKEKMGSMMKKKESRKERKRGVRRRKNMSQKVVIRTIQDHLQNSNNHKANNNNQNNKKTNKPPEKQYNQNEFPNNQYQLSRNKPSLH